MRRIAREAHTPPKGVARQVPKTGDYVRLQEEKEKLLAARSCAFGTRLSSPTERTLRNSPEGGDDIDANFQKNQSTRNLPTVVEG